MSNPWITFTCTKNTASHWQSVAEILGGDFRGGLTPEPGTSTSMWSENDWDIWNLGGHIRIDRNISGGANFYVGADTEIVGAFIGSSTLIRILRSLGATDFSNKRLSGEASNSIYIEDDSQGRNLELLESVQIERHWPQNPSTYANQFVMGTGFKCEKKMFFETGPNMGRPGVPHYFYCSPAGRLAPESS